MTAPLQAQPFLAADVGGTHVRLALLAPACGGLPQVLAYAKYRCRAHAGLDAIIGDFLASLLQRPTAVVIASAGRLLADGSVLSANLTWPLSVPDLRRSLGLDALHLINDFEAVAHAVPLMQERALLHLSGPVQAPQGPRLVLGPGTGLGAALWIPQHAGGRVLATEAGQAALAVRTPLELQLLQHLQREHRHVSIEHVLSGPGLLRLYRALCALGGTPPVHDRPDQVSAAAMGADDAPAREALEVFCALLGSSAGDLAMACGAQGVYLAGGFLPRIAPFLAGSSFAERFVDKGPMRAVLEQVPVTLVDHGQLGVMGAAAWWLARGPAED